MTQPGNHVPRNAAVVIGLSIHGLAVCRALAKCGITVHCLAERTSQIEAPARTRHAQVHFRDGLNTDRLVDHLVDLANAARWPAKAVLFPTSDRMVRSIADAWDRLEPHYLLSWSHCRPLIATLQRKDSLAQLCEQAEVRYPRSRDLRCAQDLDTITQGLNWPLVVKPARPLSSFKAIKVHRLAELEATVQRYRQDLPFVVQEWIEGDQASLYSCTTYVEHGSPLFVFPSRKLAASPPGLGQGTVFETCHDDGFCTIARRFLSNIDISGPVAVEFKRDASGQYWLIEPNVGRTEYCVDLVVQCGINLPHIEYLCATGNQHLVQLPNATQQRAWFDTDKDPACFFRHASLIVPGSKAFRAPIFPFLGHSDWRPVVESARSLMRRGWRALVRRVRRSTALPSRA